MKLKPRLKGTVVIAACLLFIVYMSGYRLDGLSTIMANASVPRDVVLMDQVE
jgi:hypothetical protein